jgi:hypothetical protein
MSETLDKQEINRNPDGTFPKGVSGNLNGRPKGQTLKEYWRQRFADMTDEEKAEFTAKVTPEQIWKMAEGNPKQDLGGDLDLNINRVIRLDE